ncbi:MAG: hypothetical protein AB1478_00890 [Nitrospirota bacterium]
MRLGRDNERAIVMYDLELFDKIFKELDELRQWCEEIEDRVRWIEEAVRLSKSGAHNKVPQWYKAWLSGKIDA